MVLFVNVNLRMCLTASRVWLGLNFPVFGEVSGVRISYLRIKSVEANSLLLVILFFPSCWLFCLLCVCQVPRVYIQGSSPLEELVKRPPVSETSSSHSHILLQPEVLYLVHHLTYGFNREIIWDI